MRARAIVSILVATVAVILWTCPTSAVVAPRAATPIPPQSFVGDYPPGAGLLLFDMGTADSPVAKGFTRVTTTDIYSPTRKYGFTTAPARAEFLTDEVTNEGRWSPSPVRVKEGIYGIDNLTVDFVADKNITFRADVPPGTYDVVVVIGHMFPTYHVYAKVNGKVVLEDEDIFTYHHARRGHRADNTYGAWYKVWDTTQAPEGVIEIQLYGDPTKGSRTVMLPPPDEKEMPEQKGGPYEHAGPFEFAGLMGVIIVPHTPLPVRLEDGRLVAAPDTSGEVKAAVRALNDRNAEQALSIIEGIKDPGTQFARGILYMWLAGTPLLDQDPEMLDAARAALVQAISQDPRNHTARVLISQCDQMYAAINLFYDRRNVAGTEVSATGRFHRVYSLTRQFRPGHPFHYKHLLYTGRMFRALVPFLYTAKSWEGLEALRRVEKDYPDNRYVRLFLHDEWSTADWPLDNYDSPPGTPPWADALRRAFRQGLDFGEWWATYGQAADGSIGGGWTDDVEVMPFWGFLVMVCPDASPKVTDMVNKFTYGLWNSPYIDRDRVFEPQFADAEHAGEPTGDGINYLIGVNYGDPRWIERNMATVKLIKNLQTGLNDKGQRWYRSGFYSASRYARDHDPARQTGSSEDSINYRGWSCVPWLVWYNQNPAALRLLVEKADSVREVAMGTARGKPKGIIPAAITWTGLPGGPESNNWYSGGFQRWPSYQHYPNNLLISAYYYTGNRMYLEPFEEIFRLMQKFRSAGGGYEPKEGAAEGSEAWVYTTLLTSNRANDLDALGLIRMLTGEAKYDELVSKKAGGYMRYRFSKDKDALAKYLNEQISAHLKRRWPHMTTEASQTDRIAYYPDMASLYMGAPVMTVFTGLPVMAVSYFGAGEDFSAVVEESTTTSLRLYIYTFYDAPREIGIRPWLLQTGGTYRVSYGIDDNNDDKIENVLGSFDLEFTSRGQKVKVTAPPRQTVIVEIGQTRSPAKRPETVPADLALTEEDIRYVRELDELDIWVHNVGGSPADEVIVETYIQTQGMSPELVERGIITRVDAPLALDPQWTRIGVTGHRGRLKPGDTVIVRVDPADSVPELNEDNNAAAVVFRPAVKVAEEPAPKQRPTVPAGRR